jgi:hypothetical protein
VISDHNGLIFIKSSENVVTVTFLIFFLYIRRIMQENYACSIINVCEVNLPNDTSSINNNEHNFGIKNACMDANQYICECCDYATSRKSSYDIHLSSKKHAKNYARKFAKIIKCILL